MTSRDEILGRVQAALRDVPAAERPADVVVPVSYRRHSDDSDTERLNLFVARTEDYGATVRRSSADTIAEMTTEMCQLRGVQDLVVPRDLPSTWFPVGVTVTPDANLAVTTLHELDGVLTACSLAIAQTGTIVLDGGPGQGRRAITLVPDYHLCVVFAHQVVGLVPEAFEHLDRSVSTHRRPLVFVSGPSATSDIELHRVEGVHGPRTLDVLLIEPG